MHPKLHSLNLIDGFYIPKDWLSNLTCYSLPQFLHFQLSGSDHTDNPDDQCLQREL